MLTDTSQFQVGEDSCHFNMKKRGKSTTSLKLSSQKIVPSPNVDILWLSNKIMKTILKFSFGEGSHLVSLLSSFALQLRKVNWGFIRIAEISKAGTSTFLSLGLPRTGHSLQLGKKVLLQQLFSR